jgi:hypothetical protein
MEIINSIMTWVMKKRIHEVELFMKYPIDVQKEVFEKLINNARNTAFGKKHHFSEIENFRTFQEQVPVSDYNDLLPYIEKMMLGEQNVLWPSDIKWFAKSSGTTSTRSKFIPVSEEALEECHIKGGKDMISIYVNNYPDTRLFTGKMLSIGGSQQINKLDRNSSSRYGDVSAVIMKNLPFWAQIGRTPSLEVALMEDWEEKLEKMAEETIEENVTGIAGVPTWTVVLIKRILEKTGKSSILEVWPSLELFIHGAVSFAPYRDLFHNLIPSSAMHYLETYNASEGFFGIQDLTDSDEMLLMLDYGIFYEFIPMEEMESEHPKVVNLENVEIGKSYAMIISTNAGLWRYNIGDTIKFTSINPFRIRITGRTKHFINAFGEEVVVENAEKAIAAACEATGAEIDDFTAAPKYFDQESASGCHEWIVEFRREPNDINNFTTELDRALREINSDYDAKRQKDIALKMPKIHVVKQDTFYVWMKKRGKLGGQNKVPRLANHREFVDDILKMINNQ